MTIVNSKWTWFIIIGVLGFILGYSRLVPKTVEVKSSEDAKTISELKAELKSRTTVHSVSVASGSVVTTTTDSITTVDSHTNGTTTGTSHNEASSYTKTGGKFITLMGLISTEPVKGITGGELLIQGNILGPIGIVAGYQRYTPTSANIGKIGVSLDL